LEKTLFPENCKKFLDNFQNNKNKLKEDLGNPVMVADAVYNQLFSDPCIIYLIF
jgi:hypothetical protein